jgi:outer membrane protein TolC
MSVVASRLARLIQAATLLALGLAGAAAQGTNDAPHPIDLPTALRLAGARNLEVQIAQQRLSEARAQRESAREQFLPALSLGVAYRRRDGMAQAVPAGTVSDTHLQSYAPGATLAAQVALGDAIYQSLAARQLVTASEHALEAQRQDATLSAAQGYFDLAKAAALAGVLREAVKVSEDYQGQLHEAVAAGVAFKGDELRVQTQTGTYQHALRQGLEQQRIHAVNLAQVLHLDPALELVPAPDELAPLKLFGVETGLDALVQRALSSRPELKQSQALVQAARQASKGAVYGPLVPSLNAQVFAGGFGGGRDNGPSNFGDAEDYQLGLSWRLGPGGLFDSGRVHAARARLAAAELGETKLKDTIASQVVAALTRLRSLSDQMALARRNVATASEALRLTRDRKQYGVGVVLEDIQAQQELTRARATHVTSIAEFNKAQYALSRAVGEAADAPR